MFEERTILQQKQIVQKLRNEFGDGVLLDTPFPEPYCKDRSQVKAIYLGCDPSNKHCRTLKHVFALPNGEPPVFRRMVTTIGDNLNRIGLSWDDVFAQNLCRNYFELETSQNATLWKKVAATWISILRDELNQFNADIPVLLSAEVLYKILLNEGMIPKKAVEFYEYRQAVMIPVPANTNRLNRPLIPFYRHWHYNLKNKKWSRYRSAVAEYLK